MPDVRSVKGTYAKSSDQHVENARQKIGAEFTDKKTLGKKKNELGKDDFMKLMSAQLKYQDPMSPLKNEEMAAQLAQFSALEQMMNVNTTLEKMAAGQKPQENVMAASLIGKRVLSDAAVLSMRKGDSPEMKFDLKGDAAKVSISVVDAKGEIVRQYDLASMKAGAQSLKWDGKNEKGMEVSPGEYNFRITAVDQNNKAVEAKTSLSGQVNGVVFENGKAMLLVDDKKLPLESVSRIELDQPNVKKASVGAPGAVNKVTDDKQEQFMSTPKTNSENISKAPENNLPDASNGERISNERGISSAGDLKKKTIANEASASRGEGNLPYPLWNPQTQEPTEVL